ncbi:nephrin-like isoform X2 [Oratosquilla oratoria]|uniref:nephrin-like isoform X2 n=1 Tax=Oratosquilla oratoria TaxID=337810 RepID=UPI003F759045
MWSPMKPLLVVFVCQLLVTPGHGQRQKFRRTPADQQAVAGTSVVIHCEVDFQKGNAQWTKDGFALGFNRTIPGYPRYTMIGDEAGGVHNLIISNVSLEDDSEFQCQVTPAQNDAPIRHAAHLTVLLRPVSIQLEKSKNGTKMPIEEGGKVSSKAGERLTIECLVKDAKPVANISWYRENHRLRPESQEDTKEASTMEERESVRSVIHITPTNLDNGKSYACRAEHPTLTDNIMQATFTLDVHYEPGEPTITGYTDGEIVRSGDRKTLTCKSKGGNPLPEVFWYKNGQQIDNNYTKHSSYSINEYEFDVEATDNKANYECHVFNVMTSVPKKDHIQLTVQFAPSSIVITAPNEVRVGDRIAISCVAANSNPKADVSLVIDNQNAPGTMSRIIRGENESWTTITNLTNYQVHLVRSDLMVNCYAQNQALGSTSTASKVIRVLRPPESPIIIGYTEGTRLQKGERQTLTCISHGGNPKATLTWFKNRNKIDSTTTEDENSAVSTLDIELQESDNNAEYRCEAINSATPVPLWNSTRLYVEFPPSSLKIKVRPRQVKAGAMVNITCESSTSNPKANLTWWKDGYEHTGREVGFKEGPFGGTTTKYVLEVLVEAEHDGAVYTCKADNGLGVTTHDAITLTALYPPVWVSLPPETIAVSEGSDVFVNVSARGNPSGITYSYRRGEEVVSGVSALNISQVNREQGGKYLVEATNSEGSSSKEFLLDVHFAPNVTVSPNETVSDSTDVHFHCIAKGNPKPEITWTREGFDADRMETNLRDTTLFLVVKNVQKEDIGKFTCKASNGVGEDSEMDTYLLVNHKPIIDGSPVYKKAAAEAGGTAVLTCRASGVPSVAFEWSNNDGSPIEPGIYEQFGRRYTVKDTSLVDGMTTYESLLEIKNITNRDYGRFWCQASNSLGFARTMVHLDGTTRPDPPLAFSVVNVTHDSITLRWNPGFDGGLQQHYRIRYREPGASYQYSDVYPENATEYSVDGLGLGTEYLFSILAFNDKGESPFTQENVRTKTLSSPPLTEVERAISRVLADKADLPRVVTLSVSTVGALLVLINVVLVACVVRRRRRKGSNGPILGAILSRKIGSRQTNKTSFWDRFSQSARATGWCMTRRSFSGHLRAPCSFARVGDCEASTDKTSSKSTIEMYAPSSYTGTVTGETLSSISEKSRESYAHEDSADEYEVDSTRATAAATYLIEQLEPPPQYASRPPHILPPPPSHNDLNCDSHYDDNIRRNQYNTVLDRASGVAPTYGTLGRRGHPTDHYNINPDPHYSTAPRYSTYSTQQQPQQPPLQQTPTSHAHPPSSHAHVPYQNSNGSLRRNVPPKLHFPKDYIRNGSMNIPISSGQSMGPLSSGGGVGGGGGGGGGGGLGYSNKPTSPTRTHPAPMLSTFAAEPSSPQGGGIPLEQRGHLV